jgi:beta-lactamase regulating signal transducer with metallopeptidase domain
MNGPSISHAVLAWLLTYALHSTVLLGGAWFLARTGRLAPAFSDVLWKTALVGGILTATAQVALDRRPAGSFALAAATLGSSAATEGANLGTEVAGPEQGDEVARPDDGAAAVGSIPAQATIGTATERGDRAPASEAGAIDWSVLLAAAWIGLAAAFVLWYLGRRLVLVGRLGDRRSVEPGELTTLLDNLCRESGMRSYVHLTASGAISSPVALGRGEICLPTAALVELEPAQLRAMLAHELAHLVRRDPLWLAIACVVERAFFFQPLNRLARHGMQETAELCADEWAARHTGGVPLARALVKVAEWIQASPLGVPVAGFAEERSQLTRRVSRLLETGAFGAPRSRAAAVAVAGIMLIGTAAFAPGVAGARVPAEAVIDVTQESRPSSPAAPAPVPAPVVELPPSEPPAPSAPSDRHLVEGAVVDTAIVRAVMARLKDEVPDVRQAAAEALGRLRHPMAINALVEALEDEEVDVRKAALHSLSNYERGVPPAPIRRMLASEDEELRYYALEILSELRDRQSIPMMERLVSDPSEEVRHQALHALDEMEAPLGEEVLGRALADASAEVRQTAAQIAGDRQVTALVPRLVALLDDRNADVRSQAAESLTEMRTEASHAALRRAMTHTDPRVRRIAVEYFGSDPDR